MRSVTAFLLAALAASCAGGAGRKLTEADRVRVVDEASAFVVHYGSTLERGDSDAVRRLFVPDERFAWFENGVKTYADVDTVVQSLANLASSGMTLRTEYSNIEVLALSTRHAHISTTFRTRGETAEGADFTFDGAATMLVERLGEDWRVVSGHTSSQGTASQR